MITLLSIIFLILHYSGVLTLPLLLMILMWVPVGLAIIVRLILLVSGVFIVLGDATMDYRQRNNDED